MDSNCLQYITPIYRIRILEKVLASELEKVSCSEVLCYLEGVQHYHKELFMGKNIIIKQQEEQSEKEKQLGGLLLLIDKLSMAYLKNRERIKSLDFLNDMYDKGFINDLFKEEMIDKLDSLWRDIDNLPISASLEDTRNYLNKIHPAVKEDGKSIFITLFTAMLIG